MGWFKNKLRKWLGIEEFCSKVKYLVVQDSINRDKLNNLQEFMTDHNKVSADIHYHHQHDSIVFVAGRYLNRDYVRLFNVQHDNMNHLVDILKDMEQTNSRGYYDEPHLNMDIKGWIDR